MKMIVAGFVMPRNAIDTLLKPELREVATTYSMQILGLFLFRGRKEEEGLAKH